MKKLLILGLAAFLLGACSSKLILDSYTIVLPEGATEVEARAASELQRYFKLISGIELPVATDAAAPAEHEILIGATNRASLEQLDKLGPDGFVIRTLGDKLAIQGGPHKGTLYGVYELLEKHFGVRHYSQTAEIVPQAASLQVPTSLYDEQVPVITHRYISAVPMDTLTNDWLRRTQTPEGRLESWGLFVHTFDLLLPHELFETHPEYFALVKSGRAKTQPCLSNPAVLDTICNNLAREMAKNPEAIYWSVSSNDNFQYCTCDQCAAIDAENGGPTGSVIHFVNQVAERFPDKQISTLAYQYSRHAPTKVKPRPNVNIMFCSIECDRMLPIAESTDSVNAGFARDMADWSRLTDNILVWDYAVSFNELQRPFANWHVLQPNIRYFAQNHVSSMFEQCAGRQNGEFSEMRAYLVAKLMWNPDLDYSAAMNDFLKGFYGKDAAPYIRQYVDLMCKNARESGVFLNTQRYALEYKDTWLSAENLARYEALMDRAVKAAEGTGDSALMMRTRIARVPLYMAEMEIGRDDPYGPRGFLEQVDGKWQAKQSWRDKLEEFTAMCQAQGVWRVTEHHSSPEEYRAQMLRMADVQQEGNLAYRKTVTENQAFISQRNGQTQTHGLSLLTDGVRGTNIWFTQWLGYYQPDIELTVDLGAVQTIKHIDSDHLQVVWESAFLPERVEAFTSVDGKTFTPAGVPVTHVVTRDPFYGTQQYNFDFAPREARYAKLRIRSMDICPVWHYYAGNDALMFIGEIVVR